MKKKCDVTITKSITIPTANYGNVKPSISLTIKDVPIDEIGEAYKCASEAADAFWALEAISLMEEERTINEIGYIRYMEQLKRNKPAMYKVIETFSEYI